MNTAKLLDAIVYDPPYSAAACVIWFHGLGADGHDFSSLPKKLDLPQNHRIRFIFPHAPIRPITLNGGLPMRGWFDIMGLTSDSPEDRTGIQKAYAQCGALIETQAALGIAYERIILGGFSQGSALALYTGLRYPHTLGGLVSLSGYLPLAASTAAEAPQNNKQIPIFIAHGTADPIVSLDLAQRSYQCLHRLGYQIDWHTYPMAHHICADEIRDLRAWLRTVYISLDEI